MFNNEDRPAPEAQSEGRLGLPPLKPPTAVGAATPQPEDDSSNTIVVPEFLTVADLAGRLHVPIRKIVWVAFRRLGTITTPKKVLPFRDASIVVQHFGFAARLPGS